MVWLKACPKCQGDLFLEQDHYGKFRTCVQCGYSRDVVETSVSMTASASEVGSAKTGLAAVMVKAA